MSRSDTRPISALTIAGSDSSGDGDGIRAQIDACFDAFRIGAVKLGMRRPTAQY